MKRVIADRGYDANRSSAALRDPATVAVLPGRRNRKRPIQYDERRYKDRWPVEAMFCRLKDFGRVATRYDRLARLPASCMPRCRCCLWHDSVSILADSVSRRRGCLWQLPAAAYEANPNSDFHKLARSRDGGQMIHAPVLRGKKLVQAMFRRCGYKIVRTKADVQHRPVQYRPTSADARNAASLLQEILPVVQHNAVTGEWPTPAFLERYFSARRLAMARLLLDQCDAEEVGIAGKRVLDVGCHAGSLLRLMRARYPEASLFGCDISDVKLAMAKRACPDAELFFSTLADLPESSSYDVVFLMEVLEHTVDPEAVVRRLLDVVSANGTLIMTVPDGREDHFPAKEYNPEFDSYSGHINFWSPESWSYFLARIAPEWNLRTAKLPTGHLFAALSLKNTP